MDRLDLFQAEAPRDVAEAEAAPAAVSFRVSGEPQGKGRPRFARGPGFARTYTPEPTRNYESTLSLAAQDAMKGRPPFEGPIAVEFIARFSIPKMSKKKTAAAIAGSLFPCKAPDADNLLKCCDALNGIVWKDDKQIVAARVLKLYSLSPGITILVKPIGFPA